MRRLTRAIQSRAQEKDLILFRRTSV
jgi:hypothetical protein